jgi:Tfp pilus assembly protein PilN
VATRRINLLPPELAQRKRARQLLSTLGAGGIVLIVLLGIVYAIAVARLASEHHALEVQQEKNDALQAQIAQLNEIARSQVLLKQKSDLLTTLTASEVRWSTVLSDVSLVIPSDAWLTTFTGNVSTTPGTTPEGVASYGSVTMNGTTFSQDDVAKWLTRLDAVEQFTFPYLSLSQKDTIADTVVVTFNSSVQLSQDALRKNQKGAQRPV